MIDWLRQTDGARDVVQLLTDALAVFEQTVEAGAEVLATDIECPAGQVDAQVRLGNGRVRWVEVKPNLTPTMIGAVVAQLERPRGFEPLTSTSGGRSNNSG